MNTGIPLTLLPAEAAPSPRSALPAGADPAGQHSESLWQDGEELERPLLYH